MNIGVVTEGIRTVFYEDGLDILFDHEKLSEKLWTIVSVDDDFKRKFKALYDTGAIEYVHEAVRDTANYSEFFRQAMERLCTADGMTVKDGEAVLMTFYDGFGFPPMTPVSNVQTIREEDVEYVGEVRDGKRHGRGREVLYYNGKPYNTREGLWLNGEIYGFLYSVDDMNVKEYCFCIDSHTVGKDTHIWVDGTVYVDEY